MDKLTYYAITGMIAIENNTIETLKKRFSIIAERRPAIRELIIGGIAVSVHIRSTAKFCELIGVKTVENVKCHIETSGDLYQSVCVNYEIDGKHYFKAYSLPFNMDKLKDIFDVEYV